VLNELLLETEPEWRLYEDLKIAGLDFAIKASPAKLLDKEEPVGRAWFCGQGWRARYKGKAGFELKIELSETVYVSQTHYVVSAIVAHDH
jgi:hypothetical protein